MFPKILFSVISKKKNFILVHFTFFYKKMFQKNTKMALKWPKMTFSKKAPVWFYPGTGIVFSPNFKCVDQKMWEKTPDKQTQPHTESGHTLKYIEVPTFSAQTGGWLDQWWVDQWERWFNYQHFLNKKGHKKISITFFI